MMLSKSTMSAVLGSIFSKFVFFFCFVVAIYDLAHDVENIHGLCLL